MPKMCRVEHCDRPPGGGRKSRQWATLCNTHRHRERRHGDPLQRGILAADLKPHLRHLDKRQKTSPKARLWGLLEARWEALQGRCRGIVAIRAEGVAVPDLKPGAIAAAQAQIAALAA